MSKNSKVKLDLYDKPSLPQWLSLSIQHLFAMFGATVLVPALVGLSPAVALVSSGLSTLAFILVTRGKVPTYLGSSFAFITPMILVKAAHGDGAIMVGGFLVGLVYGLVALIIKFAGKGWIDKCLPPVVIGPVIMVIGLGLAGTAVDMAMNQTLADGSKEYSLTYFMVALVTLGITVLASVYGKGFISIIPILVGIVGGYLFAATMGLVDFQKVIDAPWFAMPDFVIPFVNYTPSFSTDIFWLMVPVTIVTISEHIGHQVVLGRVINRDLLKDPGLDRSLFADGVATMVASLVGGPPITTYGENIGVVAITKVYSIYVFVGAALFAVTFGFIGKISALISSIPTPVMGGVSILLFGIIASSGLRMLVEEKVDLSVNRNLIISSVILVIGIGGAMLHLTENFSLEGMALAAIIGVFLNLVLPKEENNKQKEEAAA